MATIGKLSSGKYRAQVQKSGKRVPKAFATRKEAKVWAARQEYLIDHAETVNSRMAFGDLLDRYGREVSAHKGGARVEIIRIERLRRDKIARVALGDLSQVDFSDWRDRRLQQIKGASVRRELEQQSSTLKRARLEWGLMSNATARAFHAWLFSVETAMRAGEVAGLRREHLDIERRTAHLPTTKNGTARNVPLRAMREFG